MKFRPIGLRWALLVMALCAVAVTVAVTASAKSGKSEATYVIGVSNTLVGNGWREEMICAVKAQAAARGIKVVSIDQRVSAPGAWNVTNDQVAYGALGATWLFKKLGGKGNVVEMRGIAGVPADTDRHKGFLQAKKKF